MRCGQKRRRQKWRQEPRPVNNSPFPPPKERWCVLPRRRRRPPAADDESARQDAQPQPRAPPRREKKRFFRTTRRNRNGRERLCTWTAVCTLRRLRDQCPARGRAAVGGKMRTLVQKISFVFCKNVRDATVCGAQPPFGELPSRTQRAEPRWGCAKRAAGKAHHRSARRRARAECPIAEVLSLIHLTHGCLER